jgi:hypothetical protein
LIAWVVGDDQHEFWRRLELLTRALDGQNAPVVCQRMQHHRGVLAGLHHLVQIDDGALAHSPCERAIRPHGAAVANQVTPHQVGGAQIIVA